MNYKELIEDISKVNGWELHRRTVTTHTRVEEHRELYSRHRTFSSCARIDDILLLSEDIKYNAIKSMEEHLYRLLYDELIKTEIGIEAIRRLCLDKDLFFKHFITIKQK